MRALRAARLLHVPLVLAGSEITSQMPTTTVTDAPRAVMITWEQETGTWRVTYHELCASTSMGGMSADELVRDLAYRLLKRESHVGPDFTGPPAWKQRREIG